MKNNLILPILFFLTACESDLSIEHIETVSSLRKVVPGSGGQCMGFDFTHLRCVEGDQAMLIYDDQGEIKETEPFMIWRSDARIMADGTVQDYSMSMLGQTIPIKYVVDCTEEQTTFHIAFADQGFKTIIKKNADGTYEVESRQISEDGSKVEFLKEYCAPVPIEKTKSVANEETEQIPELNEDVKDEAAEGFWSWLFY